MTLTDDRAAATPSLRNRSAEAFLHNPALGPLAALILAMIVFSEPTSTFLTVDNLSLVVQQSLVVATLALGQTLIVLTSGIDLANAAIMVLGTIVLARLVTEGSLSGVALLVGFHVCALLGRVSGGLVTMLNLPPFIVILGMLTVVLAAGRLYSGGNSFPVTNDLLGILGQGGYLFGQLKVTHGMTLAVVMFAVTWYALTRTAWGRHVYALGNDPEADPRSRSAGGADQSRHAAGVRDRRPDPRLPPRSPRRRRTAGRRLDESGGLAHDRCPASR